MGLMDRVYRGLAKAGIRGVMRGKHTASQTDLTIGGWEVISGGGGTRRGGDVWENLTDGQKEETYKQSIVFACVNKAMTAVLDGDLTVMRKLGDGNFEEVPNHPVLDLMSRPNEAMTYESFVKQDVMHLWLTGESYLWKGRNAGGQLNRIFPAPTSWVDADRSKETGAITGFSVRTGERGNKTPVATEDMAVGLLPDPNDPTRGIAPLEAASRDFQTDKKRENYIGEMLTNTPVAGMVLKQPQGWEPSQKTEMRALLADLIGVGKRGGPLFLEGENAEVDFPAPLKDLDWPGLSDLSESRICAAFGIPPIIVNLRVGIESATYSNYGQANRAFYRQTMKPLWKFLAGVYTMGFLWDEGESHDLFFAYNLDEVEELQEDLSERANRARDDFKSGMITRNEARAVSSWDPIDGPGGNSYVLPINMVEVSADGSATPRLPAFEAQATPFDGDE